jgi:hypothetical protein
MIGRIWDAPETGIDNDIWSPKQILYLRGRGGCDPLGSPAAIPLVKSSVGNPAAPIPVPPSPAAPNDHSVDCIDTPVVEFPSSTNGYPVEHHLYCSSNGYPVEHHLYCSSDQLSLSMHCSVVVVPSGVLLRLVQIHLEVDRVGWSPVVDFTERSFLLCDLSSGRI